MPFATSKHHATETQSQVERPQLPENDFTGDAYPVISQVAGWAPPKLLELAMKTGGCKAGSTLRVLAYYLLTALMPRAQIIIRYGELRQVSRKKRSCTMLEDPSIASTFFLEQLIPKCCGLRWWQPERCCNHG